MKTFEQRKYLNAVIAFVDKQYFSSVMVSKEDVPISPSRVISGVAGLLHNLTKDNDILKEHLVSSLTRSTIPSLGDSLAACRCVIAALSKDEGQNDHQLMLGVANMK